MSLSPKLLLLTCLGLVVVISTVDLLSSYILQYFGDEGGKLMPFQV